MSTSSKLFFTNIDSLSGLTESIGGTGCCDGGECFADVTDGGGGGVYFGGVCGGLYFGGVHNGGVYFGGVLGGGVYFGGVHCGGVYLDGVNSFSGFSHFIRTS